MARQGKPSYAYVDSGIDANWKSFILAIKQPDSKSIVLGTYSREQKLKNSYKLTRKYMLSSLYVYFGNNYQ